MNIIILGAGQVGSGLADILSVEGHNITLVDISAQKLKDCQNRLDIQTIVGSCTYPNVLRDAGAEQADMLIAVTSDDESNMVACQVAHSLFHTPQKIARIRSPEYFVRPELFGGNHLPIDIFINPEQLITRYISQIIMHPGALQVIDFGEGQVKLVSVKPYYGGTCFGKSIAELRAHLDGVPFNLVGLFRNKQPIPIDEETTIELKDEIFFMALADDVGTVLSALRPKEQPYKRVMIAGSGQIGHRLAEILEKRTAVKLIDPSAQRCQASAKQLQSTLVLHGDVCDQRLLINENIEHVDVFCALTNDDENNIIACLQAKKLGAKQVMALISRTAYVDLIAGSTINIALSPQQATIGSILAYIRHGDIIQAHTLRHGSVEVAEVVVHGERRYSKMIGRRIDNIPLPFGCRVGAVIRDNLALIASEETVIESGDHLVLFIFEKSAIPTLERLLQANSFATS